MSLLQGISESQSADEQTVPPQPYNGVHGKTILLGMILVAVMSYVAPYADLVVQQLPLGTLQFAPGAVGAFLLVYIAIQALRKLGFMRWINAADMLTIYVMLFVGVFVVARGLLERLIPALNYLNYFATPANGYAKMFSSHLRPGLVAFDPHNAAKQTASLQFYEGGRHLSIPWNIWITPLLTWFALFALIIWTFICLASILRRQWSDRERLSFPQTILPIQLIDDGESATLFRNPLTWFGIMVPGIIFTLNGLHESYPAIPAVPLVFPGLEVLFKNPPWNQMQGLTIFVSFAAMGFAYFLPSDLLFSLWFFFILTRLADVVSTSMGIVPPGMPSYPTRAYQGFQAAGAYVMLALTFLYSGRETFKQALRETFNSVKDASYDSDELLPRRTAVLGILIGFAGIIAWSVWAGMSLWLAVMVWAIYIFVTATVLARSVSEAGLLMTETSFRPSDIVGMFTPRGGWGETNWTILSMFNAVFFRDMRGLFLALFMDHQKLAGDVRMHRKQLLLPLLLAILVSLIVGTATHLALSYQHGALNLGGYGYNNTSWAFSDAASILKGAPDALATAKEWFGGGFLFAGFLVLMRARFVGFPFHPLAYALAPTWTMFVLWFSILTVWVIKTLILRYGGSKMYRQIRPMFIGMIIGEFGSGALWAILAAATKINAPLFPWGG